MASDAHIQYSILVNHQNCILALNEAHFSFHIQQFGYNAYHIRQLQPYMLFDPKGKFWYFIMIIHENQDFELLSVKFR